MKLPGKTALITGASRGIGRAIALRLAREGCQLVLTYYRDKSGAMDTLRNCLKNGTPRAIIIQLDVKDSRSIKAALRKTKTEFKTIAILINNAGVNVIKPFARQTEKEIDEQLHTNLGGLMHVTQAFLPIVKNFIINIASRAGKVAYSGMAPYCATKFGVRGFTQALAKEYPRLKITALNPGRIATRMVNFKGRPPEEVANVVARLLDGALKVRPGGDIDSWKITGRR